MDSSNGGEGDPSYPSSDRFCKTYENGEANGVRSRHSIRETHHTMTKMETLQTEYPTFPMNAITPEANDGTFGNHDAEGDIERTPVEPFFIVQEQSSCIPMDMNQQHQLAVAPNGLSGNANNGGNGYNINYDPEPQIVRKQASGAVVYKQEVAVRYLRPPTPPLPGPLIIKEVRANQAPPAPPLIIRQRPPRPATPPPLIIRERPPQAPQNCRPKIITRNLPAPPPPPRRVIIERLPPLPPKPRPIIVERWLPYKQQKRRVIYQRAALPQQPQQQKNLIIQWEGAQVKVLKEFRNLGIARADPNKYVQKYGSDLKHTSALPDFAKQAKVPNLPNLEENSDNEFNGQFDAGNYDDGQNFNSMQDAFLEPNVGQDPNGMAFENGQFFDPNMSLDPNDFSNMNLNDNQMHEGFDHQMPGGMIVDGAQHPSSLYNDCPNGANNVQYMNGDGVEFPGPHSMGGGNHKVGPNIPTRYIVHQN